MRIVFIGMNDWANECHKIAHAINAYGGNASARVIIQHSHPFGYPEDLVLDRGVLEEAEQVVYNATHLVTTGDGDYNGLEAMLKALGTAKRPVAALHVGRAYRESPAAYDAADKAWGFKRRFFCMDLLRWKLDDPEATIYTIPHYEVDKQLVLREDGEVRAVHCPSNRERKGSDIIEQAFRIVEAKYPHFKGTTVFGRPAPEAWEAMKRSDIFVDHVEEVHGGFGGASMEGLSYGCALVTASHHVCPEIDRFLDMPPHVRVRTLDDIVQALSLLVENKHALLDLRTRGLKWANAFLSPKFTYEHWDRWLRNVGESRE